MAQAKGEEIKREADSRLRYNEPLKLNLKGYTQSFKSITRPKRENMLLGNRIGGGATEPTPAMGHYNPRYNSVVP